MNDFELLRLLRSSTVHGSMSDGRLGRHGLPKVEVEGRSFLSAPKPHITLVCDGFLAATRIIPDQDGVHRPVQGFWRVPLRFGTDQSDQSDPHRSNKGERKRGVEGKEGGYTEWSLLQAIKVALKGSAGYVPRRIFLLQFTYEYRTSLNTFTSQTNMAQVISKDEIGSLFSDEKWSGDVTAMFSMESATQVDSAVTTWEGKTFSLKTGEDKMGGWWNVDWEQHKDSGIQCGGTTLFPGSREEAVNAVVEAVNASKWWQDDENVSKISDNEFSASIRPQLEQEIPCQVTLSPGVSVKLSQFPGAEAEATDLISKGQHTVPRYDRSPDFLPPACSIHRSVRGTAIPRLGSCMAIPWSHGHAPLLAMPPQRVCRRCQQHEGTGCRAQSRGQSSA